MNSARPASLLTLEVFMFFNFYFSWVYLLLGLVIYIYKAATFYYP